MPKLAKLAHFLPPPTFSHHQAKTQQQSELGRIVFSARALLIIRYFMEIFEYLFENIWIFDFFYFWKKSIF